jgi:hypothetical protein
MSTLNVGTANLTHSLNLPVLTTAQRNSISPQAGNIIFNSDLLVVQYYDGTAWTDLGQKGGSLYDFTTFTFKPIVAAGSGTGPNLSQIQSAYSSVSWSTNYITMGPTQGYQRWTVPVDGIYEIEAGGAAGGKDPNTSFQRAYGALVKGRFQLAKEQVLEMVIGSRGNEYSSPHYNEAGGGGGTFVKNHTVNTLLIVAGGAGGAPSSAYGGACTRNLSIGQGQSTQQGGIAVCAATPATPSLGYGGNTAGSYQGGAGGGYLGNGANGGTHCCTSTGGGGYNSGAVGGLGNCCYSSQTQNGGGFGGGGGGQLSGPGGGGGYTGGSCSGQWSSFSEYGGGGGSYNIGSNQSSTAGGNTGSNSTSNGGYDGAGYCKITLVG